MNRQTSLKETLEWIIAIAAVSLGILAGYLVMR